MTDTSTSINRAELGLVQAIRAGGTAAEFRLTVRHQHDGWLVETSFFPHSDVNKMRGVGPTFAAAWHAMDTLAVEPISPVPIPSR